MKVHEVKALPRFFNAYTDGTKPWSIRYDDRHYQDGDVLVVREWSGEYSGRQAEFRIVKVWDQMPDHIAKGHVVLTLAPRTELDGGA